MSRKILMIPMLMLSLFSKLLGSSDVAMLIIPADPLSTSLNSQSSIYDSVKAIKSQVILNTLTRKAAIKQLYLLGAALPKGEKGIADII